MHPSANILITGLPRSGKTTLLREIIESFSPKTGFLTPEIRANDERVGFEMVTSTGAKKLLADTTRVTPDVVGRYFVQRGAIEDIAIEVSSFSEADLLYIDEIGQMELVSSRFIELVHTYFDAPNRFIGTLSQVYDSPFMREIKSRGDVHIFELNSDNRDRVRTQLQDIFFS